MKFISKAGKLNITVYDGMINLSWSQPWVVHSVVSSHIMTTFAFFH